MVVYASVQSSLNELTTRVCARFFKMFHDRLILGLSEVWKVCFIASKLFFQQSRRWLLPSEISHLGVRGAKLSIFLECSLSSLKLINSALYNICFHKQDLAELWLLSHRDAISGGFSRMRLSDFYCCALLVKQESNGFASSGAKFISTYRKGLARNKMALLSLLACSKRQAFYEFLNTVHLRFLLFPTKKT